MLTPISNTLNFNVRDFSKRKKAPIELVVATGDQLNIVVKGDYNSFIKNVYGLSNIDVGILSTGKMRE